MRTFRRWFLRLLALLALGGVAYGVYTIVKAGTKDDGTAQSSIQPALETLADSQERLGAQLDALKPGRAAPKLRKALRAARRDQAKAVKAERRRQIKKLPIDDKGKLDDALGAEFDYLDAVGAVIRNSDSKLLKTVGNRAQAAKDAFTDLPDSGGVEDGIRGTQNFIAWAKRRP